MAPYSTSDSLLMDKAAMIQSESWQQTADIDAAQGMARSAWAAQMGGRRGVHRRRTQRGGHYPWSSHLQSFGAPSMLVAPGTPIGVNPQFAHEGTVNSLYRPDLGPQVARS